MSFFRIQDGKFIIDLEYVLMYPQFIKIYNRGEDDAIKIFKYIYEVADYKTYSNKQNYKTTEQHEYAIKLANLNSTFKADKEIKDAIKEYKRLNYNINAELLEDLKSTLYLSIKINSKIHAVLDTELSNATLQREDIPIIMNLQNKLFELIDTLPDKIKKLKELEALVYSEIHKARPMGRGTGKVIPDSYEGNPDIEGTE